MIRFLRIRDFALIRELDIEFSAGLSLLTGETGSGKSILVDALGLLLGARSSAEMVRSNCDTAIVEGFFAADSAGEMAALLLESGIEPEEDGLLIRREISANGRGRVFVNNSMATLTLLRSIGEKIADIHGQHDRQSLLDLPTHLRWLDRFGGNTHELRAVGDQFKALRETGRLLDSMTMDEQERLRRADILQFQLTEIRRVKPEPQERVSLEIERNILAHRERIAALATEAYALLYESENSMLSLANRLLKITQELESFDAGWTSHREALRETLYRLEDVAYAARDYSSGMDFSPERLNQVEQRLSDLERLAQKYGQSVEEILAFAERCEVELQGLVSYSDRLQSLTDQFESQWKEYLELAGHLSEKRRALAVRLERALRKEFQALALEKMALEVRFAPREPDGHPRRIPASCGPEGIDHVEFLVAPNKGEEMRPLARIASGGELSRVMLAIRSLCGTGETSRTLVFDEVDAGIGGRVAEAVGRRLRDLARGNQVLCVTHLPQIAAFANHHYIVQKQVVAGRTETSIRLLDQKERVEELARMLGGELITEAARRHAREMLAHSTAG
jgi:DNA repair protein RecN (Recombination protein N)